MKPLIILCLAALCAFTSRAQSSSVLKGGEFFKVNIPLESPNKRYIAVFQSDGNLVVYDRDPSAGGKAIWNSGTNGKTITLCAMQSDGNLVLYNGSVPVWNSTSWSSLTGSYWIQMQDDGNLVIYNEKTQALGSTMGGVAPWLHPQPKSNNGQNNLSGFIVVPIITILFCL